MEPIIKLHPSAIKDKTKQQLLYLAYEPDAFVDISYKISFFKLPSKLQKFNTTGLNCVCPPLRVNESVAPHKDKNRYNEYENLYINQTDCDKFCLTENCGETYFYDDNKDFAVMLIMKDMVQY